MSAPKPDIKEDQVDHYVLKPGDTILVHACEKVFVVKCNGIKSVKAISSKDDGIVSITRKSAGEFEIGFSCKTIESALGIYPLLFTSANGKGVTIYFSPMPDLDGSLHYHSSFEIEM